MPSLETNDFQNLSKFLQALTPEAWLDAAIENLPLLLIDHAHCERKAAATALNFIAKYPEKLEIVKIMSPLAREELLHFEKVQTLLDKRNISFTPLQPCNYAQALHQHVTKGACKDRLRDQLIVGAIIEARSCERFNALIPRLTDSCLSKFYASLVKSESRHFQEYLHLARLYSGDIDERLQFFLSIENQLIHKTDEIFRFHSGIPI